MTKLEQQQHIQQGLQTLLSKKRLSQNELARLADVSAANISHMLNGRADKSISEEIWNKAAAVLGDLNEQHLLSTGNFEAVRATCERARQECALAIVLGEPGYGKTSALWHYYCRQPSVYFVAFRYSDSRREFFLRTARALAVDTGKRPTLAQLIQLCADKLNATTGSLLLIDEASTMQPEKLNYVRELRELTHNNAGIVLAGATYFEARLKRYTTRERDGVPEFVSRVSRVTKLAPPTVRELVAVARANGVPADAAKELVKTGGALLPEYRALRHLIRGYHRTAVAEAHAAQQEATPTPA